MGGKGDGFEAGMDAEGIGLPEGTVVAAPAAGEISAVDMMVMGVGTQV